MNNRYSKLFLDIAYYINDKEQIEKIVESRAFIKLFNHEDTYYDYYEEIYYILKIICKLNNIEILKKILYYADDYKYYEIPSLNSIIQFLLTNDKTQLCLLWDEKIKNDNLENYFNATSHYLLITPFIFTYNTRIDLLSIAKKINNIEDLWITNDIANFNYRNIDINIFFKEWDNALIKAKLISKTIKINSECMDLSFDKIHPMLSKKLASFSNLDNIQLI